MWGITPCWSTSPSLRMSPSDECVMSSCRRCCCHAVSLSPLYTRIALATCNSLLLLPLFVAMEPALTAIGILVRNPFHMPLQFSSPQHADWIVVNVQVYLQQRTRRIEQAYTLSGDASDPGAMSSLGTGYVSRAALLARSCRCLLTAAPSPAAEVALRLARPRCQGLTGTQQDCVARMHMACAMAA